MTREEERNHTNGAFLKLMGTLMKDPPPQVMRSGYKSMAAWLVDNLDEYVMSSIRTSFQMLPLNIKQVAHYALYLKTIKVLGTEKHRDWLMRGATLEDKGCFCMTELAHGSNVQGVQTTATYDPEAKEFILHSPTQESMKFWIGNLGKTANMAVVFAQLYVAGKHEGVHVFLVRIRDPKTHLPLPGFTIGDCGHKMGMHGIDNGFMLMHGCRVPSWALLDKYAAINEEGVYNSPIKSKTKRFAAMISALSGGRVALARQSNVRFLDILNLDAGESSCEPCLEILIR